MIMTMKEMIMIVMTNSTEGQRELRMTFKANAIWEPLTWRELPFQQPDPRGGNLVSSNWDLRVTPIRSFFYIHKS